MTPQQADNWVQQELKKIKTKADALEHLRAYNTSCNGFFKSQAGIESERRDPEARKARHTLAAKVVELFK